MILFFNLTHYGYDVPCIQDNRAAPGHGPRRTQHRSGRAAARGRGPHELQPTVQQCQRTPETASALQPVLSNRNRACGRFESALRLIPAGLNLSTGIGPAKASDFGNRIAQDESDRKPRSSTRTVAGPGRVFERGDRKELKTRAARYDPRSLRRKAALRSTKRTQMGRQYSRCCRALPELLLAAVELPNLGYRALSRKAINGADVAPRTSERGGVSPPTDRRLARSVDKGR